MRFDSSPARLGRLDQDTLCVAVEAFRLIDEARRLTLEVPRLMHEAPGHNVGPQRLIEEARALSDAAKRLVREPLGIMHEVQKLDLDANRVWVRAAVHTVARESPFWRLFSSEPPNGATRHAECRLLVGSGSGPDPVRFYGTVASASWSGLGASGLNV